MCMLRLAMSLFIILNAICAFAQETLPAGEVAPVQTIQFIGNTAITSGELQAAIGMKPSEPLSVNALGEAIKRIEDAYAQRGYLADFVYYEIQGQQPPRTLIFHIREVHVAGVRIAGLVHTREQIVRRFVQVEPGELYNQLAIQRSVSRLNDLGIFQEIQGFIEEGAEPGQVIVVIQIKEAKTQRVDLGGTYSPEGRLIGQVTYTQLNLFGRAQQLTAQVNAGTIAGKIGGQITYLNPLVGTPDTILLARAFSDVNFRFSEALASGEARYFERRTGAQAILTRSAGTATTLSYGLRYENTTIENLPVSLLTTDFSSGKVFVSSARLLQDRRLFLVLPASGNYWSGTLEAGYSSPDIGGSSGIAKAQFDRRWYIPLKPITPADLSAERPKPTPTLAIRLSAGTSTGKLPFYEQYFVGGVTDLRGYRESRFWGRSFLTLNTEVRMPISRSFVGLVFVDVGDAWNSDFLFSGGASTAFPQHKGFSPRAGAGVGIWWVTDLGAIRFEYAKGEDNRLHFAIGESF